MWYLDDGTLCGPLNSLCHAFNIIEEECPSQGLHLNHNKSLIAFPSGVSIPSSLPAGVPSSGDGFVLLGSPIGSATFCTSTVLKRVSKVQESFVNPRDIQDCKIETFRNPVSPSRRYPACFALVLHTYLFQLSFPSMTS